MTGESYDALRQDEPRRFALRELAEISGWSEAELVELVEYGALTPAGPEAGGSMFGARSITVARTAFRLREAFELEPHGADAGRAQRCTGNPGARRRTRPECPAMAMRARCGRGHRP